MLRTLSTALAPAVACGLLSLLTPGSRLMFASPPPGLPGIAFLMILLATPLYCLGLSVVWCLRLKLKGRELISAVGSTAS